MSVNSTTSRSIYSQTESITDGPLTIQTLPAEIIHKIGFYLNTTELVNAKLTCRQWNRIYSNSTFWEELAKSIKVNHSSKPSTDSRQNCLFHEFLEANIQHEFYKKQKLAQLTFGIRTIGVIDENLLAINEDYSIVDLNQNSIELPYNSLYDNYSFLNGKLYFLDDVDLDSPFALQNIYSWTKKSGVVKELGPIHHRVTDFNKWNNKYVTLVGGNLKIYENSQSFKSIDLNKNGYAVDIINNHLIVPLLNYDIQLINEDFSSITLIGPTEASKGIFGLFDKLVAWNEHTIFIWNNDGVSTSLNHELRISLCIGFGNKIYASLEDSRISSWDDNGHHVRDYLGHSNPVNCIGNLGNHLVTGDTDGIIRVWYSTKPSLALEIRKKNVSADYLSVDKGKIHCLYSDGTFLEWDFSQKKLLNNS
ncbi:MAG: F-box-like domain-containing protein [Parachlamydiales bacterium]|nr:F-box-like domain-containing protein [Parachlamydiales bacterium]